jgi:hypothetical protein
MVSSQGNGSSLVLLNSRPAAGAGIAEHLQLHLGQVSLRATELVEFCWLLGGPLDLPFRLQIQRLFLRPFRRLHEQWHVWLRRRIRACKTIRVATRILCERLLEISPTELHGR